MARTPTSKTSAHKTSDSPSRRRKAHGKPTRIAADVLAKAEDRRLGVTIIKTVAAAAGIGAALLALTRLKRPNPAEHAAPDLAADAPRPGTNRAPEAFRPDPTAVPTKAEYDSLRPATGPAPSMVQGNPGLSGATAAGAD